MMTDDEQLLHAYARERSEAAFGELVTRHIDFVYSTALRVVSGDSHLAQDVAQTVFIDLARKAGSLPGDVGLAGWLHHHTCYTAAKAVRTERRRQTREQTAMEMRALDDNTRPEWELVAPYLDESLDQLNPADRDALVLRFLKQQDLRAVGEALGISDDAARKRVDRALEKLHVLLKHRGATLSAAALGTALATEAVTAAPAGLAGSVAGAALASAAVGGFGVGVLKFLALTKAKLLVVAGVAAVAVAALVLGPTAIVQGMRPQESSAEDFLVKGQLTRETLTGDKETRRYTFSITVNGPRWLMHVEVNDPVLVARFHDYCEAAYDGTNLYYVYSLRTWVETQIRAGKDVGPNTAVGIVSKRPLPQFGLDDELGPIWLTYASARFFQGQTNFSSIRTPATVGVGKRGLVGPLNDYHQPAIVRLSAKAPGLPTEVYYLEDSLTQISPYGFTNTVFQAENFTETGTVVTIPKAATLTVYYPRREPSEALPIVKPEIIYRLTTTAVEPGKHLAASRPNLPELTAVSDLRFADNPSDPVEVLYYNVKGAWYSDDQARRLPEYRTALAHVKPPQRDPSPSQEKIYDESANAPQQIAAAIARARMQNKRVLLQFGANWCVWCRKLHSLFATDRTIRERLDTNYIVVLVDVDQGHNSELRTKYGADHFGLPFIVVLDSDGEHLTTQNTEELADGDHHSPQKVLAFLKTWEPKK